MNSALYLQWYPHIHVIMQKVVTDLHIGVIFKCYASPVIIKVGASLSFKANGVLSSSAAPQCSGLVKDRQFAGRGCKSLCGYERKSIQHKKICQIKHEEIPTMTPPGIRGAIESSLSPHQPCYVVMSLVLFA